MDAKTIRLVYPQWQGGDITRWIPEISDPALAARGYYLGDNCLISSPRTMGNQSLLFL